MRKVLKHLEKISSAVTVEVQKCTPYYKAMVYVDGGCLAQLKSDTCGGLKKNLYSKELKEMIIRRVHYDGIMRDKAFSKLLKEL